MFEQLKDIVSSKFKVPDEEFVPGVSLTDLGLDSLDMVELSLVIEQELGVKVSDDELADADVLQTVATLVQTRSVAA